MTHQAAQGTYDREIYKKIYLTAVIVTIGIVGGGQIGTYGKPMNVYYTESGWDNSTYIQNNTNDGKIVVDKFDYLIACYVGSFLVYVAPK